MFLAPSLLLLGILPPPVFHEQSVSHSRLRVRDAAAVLDLRFQTPSLLEGLPGLDGDGDGRLGTAELAAGRGEVERYLRERWRLFPGDGGELAGSLTALSFATDLGDEDRRFQWIDARLAFAGERSLEGLEVDSRLFTEVDSYHRDFLTLIWNDDAPVQHVFRHGDAPWPFHPAHVRRPGVLLSFLRLGIEHILGGYDHLCFLVVLIVAARSWRGLLGVVTAFTVAHSITLALAALDAVRLDPGFVELAIALSIAYVAVENLLARGPRTPWIEAFVFGLLHGLGFAGFLSDALVGEPLVISALFGFNLGVETGQLLFVATFSLLVLLFRRASRRNRAPDQDRPGIVPRAFRRLASAAVAVLALFWFAQRAGWVE